MDTILQQLDRIDLGKKNLKDSIEARGGFNVKYQHPQIQQPFDSWDAFSISTYAPLKLKSLYYKFPSDWYNITNILREDTEVLPENHGKAIFLLESSDSPTVLNTQLDILKGIFYKIKTSDGQVFDYPNSAHSITFDPSKDKGGTRYIIGYTTETPKRFSTFVRNLSESILAVQFYNCSFDELNFSKNKGTDILPVDLTPTKLESIIFSGYYDKKQSTFKLKLDLSESFANLISLQNIVFPNKEFEIEHMYRTFMGCTKLRTFDFPGTWNCITSFNGTFKDSGLEYIEMRLVNVLYFYNTLSFNETFANCNKLHTIIMSYSLSGIINRIAWDYCFFGCSNLRNLYLITANRYLSYNEASIPNLNQCPLLEILFHTSRIESRENVNTDVDLSNNPKLTYYSLLNTIEILAILTDNRQLKLGSVNLAKLSEDDIKRATDKGWTVIA